MAQRATASPAKQDRRRLRTFGLTVGIAFCVVMALLVLRHKPLWPLFGALAALLIIPALIAPAILAPVERVWMKFARVMGWFMTRVILGIVFVVVFTPAGLIMRLLGKDPLELRRDSGATSYWHKRSARDPSPQQMERMF